MGIKVHGVPGGASLRVLATLYEKDIDFELLPVDMRSGAHKQQPFISLNPFGQVPAFEDGDIKLFESRAITRYIAYTYESKGTPLIYKEGKQMAELAVWLEVEAHQFDSVINKLAWELIYKGMFGQQTDNAVVEENEAKLGKVLDVYEARLAKNKYIAGDSFTLADLHHLPGLDYLVNRIPKVKHVIDERPHLSAWSKDVLARPSCAKALGLAKQG